MSEEDLERYETEMELQLYKEYRDVLPLFSYVVETERRFYLANSVELTEHDGDARNHLELPAAGCVGVGHLPPGAGPLRAVRARGDVQGRQHRGDPAGRIEVA